MESVRSTLLYMTGLFSSIWSVLAEQPYQKEIAYTIMIVSGLLILRKFVRYIIKDIKGWRKGDFLNDN